MRNNRLCFTAVSAVVVMLALGTRHAAAQDWFVPSTPGATAPGTAAPGAGGATPPPAPHTPARPRPAEVRPRPPLPAPPQPTLPIAQPQVPAPPEPAEPPTVQVDLPPAPTVPPIPKGAEPPVAHLGVLGVPEVMQASTAAQEVNKVLSERRQKLNDDAQKEQAAWRDLQQQLVNARGSLTPDQIRTREQQLQDRITNAQKGFRERDRILQEAAQYSLAQIERTMSTVVQAVAESRGMNIVLHRQGVALNFPGFDITDDVAKQLNAVLPHVLIPADGMSPEDMQKAAKAMAAAQGTGTAPTPPAAGTPPATPDAPAAPKQN